MKDIPSKSEPSRRDPQPFKQKPRELRSMNQFSKQYSLEGNGLSEQVRLESERKRDRPISYFPNPRLFNPPETWNRGFLGSVDITYGSFGYNNYGQDSIHLLGKRVNLESEFRLQGPESKVGKIHNVQKTNSNGHQESTNISGLKAKSAWTASDVNCVKSGSVHFGNSAEVSKNTECGKTLLTNEQESTHADTPEAEGEVPQKIDLLLQNKDESDKAILKILIYEVIINEKVNKHRISFLPNQVVELLLLFLKKHYGFCLESATRAGTAQKYLYLLRTEGSELDSEDALLVESFRFRFQLFMYGAKKKFPKNASKLAEDYYVTKCLFDLMYPKELHSEESRASKLSKFWSLVQMTFSRDSVLTLEAIKAWLPKQLLAKLLKFSPELLSKYYSIRLKKYLKELFSGQDLSIALLRQRIKSSPKIPLLSDLLHDPGLKSALERRNYHLGPCLDLG